jgi:hypothetical protein
MEDAMLEQLCTKPGCNEVLAYAANAAAGDGVTCANNHVHVIARCPNHPCPSGRMAFLASALVNMKFVHPPFNNTFTCARFVKIANMHPPELTAAV